MNLSRSLREMRLASSVTALVLLASLPAFAAPLELPRPSPNAKLTQTVGLTDITIEYSSPAVHGRTIWGALQPWGEVWRAGANATTKLTFSREVTVGSVHVPAGSYAFFVIPNQTGPWTLILNKDFEQGGSANYKKELDVVRVDATPEAISNRERLAYTFSNFTDDAGTLDLEWEKVRVSLPFKLGTEAQVAANIKAIKSDDWEGYASAAGYERLNRKDYDAGLAFAEKSIKAKATWQGEWAKAQLEAAKGDYKAAVASTEKAQKLGKDAPKFFQDGSAKSLAEWKAKSTAGK